MRLEIEMRKDRRRWEWEGKMKEEWAREEGLIVEEEPEDAGMTEEGASPLSWSVCVTTLTRGAYRTAS